MQAGAQVAVVASSLQAQAAAVVEALQLQAAAAPKARSGASLVEALQAAAAPQAQRAHLPMIRRRRYQAESSPSRKICSSFGCNRDP